MMLIVNLNPSLTCAPIPIGERGENVASTVTFDFSEWAEEYGEGAVSLLVKRNGDTSAYPVLLSVSDHVATWVISSTDTSVKGYGKAEFIYTSGDLIAKTAVFGIFVSEDLGQGGEAPDPYESWIDTLTALGGETLINAQRAETAATTATAAATNAATSATNASQSAGFARDAAEAALNSADSASASAEDASRSAQAAEQSAQTAEEVVSHAVEEAEGYATQAAASASAAEASETAAYDSANTAAEEAEVARTAATTATTAATNASASASSASDSATAASGSASSANASATTATNAATSATQSANNAAQSADMASVRATAAAQSASSASDSATSAGNSASMAAVSATVAVSKAGEAESSAQEAAEQAAKLNNYLPTDTASGAIASFSDGADGVPVKALSVVLEPVQDLNGQTSPYPAGGGKNLLSTTIYDGATYNPTIGSVLPLTESTKEWTQSGNSFSCNIATAWSCIALLGKFPSGATDAYIKLSVSSTGSVGSSLCYLDSNFTVLTCVNNTSNPQTLTYKLSPSADPNRAYYCVILTGRDTANVTITVTEPQLELGSSATTYAPYSNICPITGHSTAQVWRSGVNMFDEANATVYPRFFNGENEWQYSGDSSSYMFPCKPSTTYTVSAYQSALTIFRVGTISTIPSGNESVPLSNITKRTASGSVTLTTSSDSVAIVVQINNAYGTARNGLVQIETGSTAHAYESPSIVNITIPLGQTVYGGTVDVVGGVCTVDRAYFKGGWTQYNASNGYKAYRRDNCPLGKYSVDSQNLPMSSAIGEFGAFSSSSMTKNIIQPPRSTSNTAYLALSEDLDPSDVDLTYLIGYPITIPLTPEQLTTLLGTNNIWSDSGNVAVEYRADIQKYIAKVIAEAIA